MQNNFPIEPIDRKGSRTLVKNALPAPFLAALLTTAVAISSARGDDLTSLPAAVILATSTGYWQDETGQPTDASGAVSPATVPTDTATPVSAPGALPRHGYYKLYAVRQTDRTSKVYLQQVLSTDDGPQVLSTTELVDITALKGYVTDIRPENSGGIIREPGLFATIFIKRDIDGDAQAWNVLRDDLGEVTVERVPE